MSVKKTTAKKVTKNAPKLKSRFFGMIRYTSVPAQVSEVSIEGVKYYEYKGLKGVYFSQKLFV